MQFSPFETCVFSKSWYNAWSTRPFLYFRQYPEIEKNEKVWNYARETLQRYKSLNLKLEKLKFCMVNDNSGNELIEDALKLGVCELDLAFDFSNGFHFPAQVFANGYNVKKLSLAGYIPQLIDNTVALCPNLLSLTLTSVGIGEKCIDNTVVLCRHLLSLTLSSVRIGKNCIDSILLGCLLLENLDLSCNSTGSIGFEDDLSDNYPNLRFLRLGYIDIQDEFFTQFSFRFPCIERLTLANCRPKPHSKYLRLSSDSLKYLSLDGQRFEKADFDVPNIRKFVYNTYYLNVSSIKFSAVAREWESQVKVYCLFHKIGSFSGFMLKLQRSLIELSGSRISLCLRMFLYGSCCKSGMEIPCSSIALPVVENLKIQTNSPTSALLSVFRICIPKFITGDDDFIRFLYKMMKQENDLDFSSAKEHLIRSYILEEVGYVDNQTVKRRKVSPSEKVIAGDLIPHKSKQFRFRLR